MTWQIIENGVDNFTPIIDKLQTIAGEVIPYMIYIALACLWITLAYKAIKYIINYLDYNLPRQQRNLMKERRRRRRRNRRFVRSVKNHTYTFNW